MVAVAAADHNFIAFGIDGNTSLKLDEIAHIAHDGHSLEILGTHNILTRRLIWLNGRTLCNHCDFAQFQSCFSNLEINRRRQVNLNPDVGLTL